MIKEIKEKLSNVNINNPTLGYWGLLLFSMNSFLDSTISYLRYEKILPKAIEKTQGKIGYIQNEVRGILDKISEMRSEGIDMVNNKTIESMLSQSEEYLFKANNFFSEIEKYDVIIKNLKEKSEMATIMGLSIMGLAVIGCLLYDGTENDIRYSEKGYAELENKFLEHKFLD